MSTELALILFLMIVVLPLVFCGWLLWPEVVNLIKDRLRR